MAAVPRKPRSFWDILEAYPPYYYRLWAKRSPRVALTDAEIAIASGIDLTRVRQIFKMDNWHAVSIGELHALMAACNFNLLDYRMLHRVEQYEYICKKRNVMPFQWLRESPKWESEFLPLIRQMQSRVRSAAA
jgi:hypothetical protein